MTARPVVLFGAAFTTAVRMVDRVHDDTAVMRTLAAPRGIGFGADDNEVTLLFADGGRHGLPRASKRAIADQLWSLLAARLPAREVSGA